ncbi:Hypp1665 [Branchiostoma lanceolatum]|uniref:Hypp1665 protein n=1 Tax=Branchiostoma lanceolatum TaxID=7740 RepID=A0A8K0ELP5_BRALA|nr:Hypp1665 [Branchiostoma lanceolatum]
MATGQVQDSRTPGELYNLLGTSTDATQEDIINAYKEKVLSYEKTIKTSKDKRRLGTERQKFAEVSNAFYILSNNERRDVYNKSNVIVEPAKRDKKAPRDNEYFVQHNEGSITIHIPVGSVKGWIETIEAHYDMSTEDKDKNGHQITVPFRTPESDEIIGFVTLHVYQTCKILVQGSAFYLWTMYTYEHLKQQQQRPLTEITDTEIRCEDIICIKCERPGPEDIGVIQCDACRKWYHYGCTDLQQSQLEYLINNEEREYICCDCLSDALIDNTSSTDAPDLYSPPEHETIPKKSNSVDKLESILMSVVTTDKGKVDTLSSRISHLETLVSKTMDGLTEKMAKAGDVEVLKKRINALAAENKNLRSRIALLEQKGAKNAAITIKQTDNIPPLSSKEPETTDNAAQTDNITVPNIPTNNKFDVLAVDSTSPEEQRSADLSANNDNAQSQAGTTDKSEVINNGLNAEIVIVGDSNTRGIVPSILYPEKQVHKQSAMTIPQAIDTILATPYSNPRCIVFHVGTNDVKQERAANGVTENMRQLVVTTHDKFPNADIVLSSIPPRKDRHLMEITNDVNGFLRILDQETSYVSLADNSNLEANGLIKQTLYRDDGYHLNRSGLKVLAANFKAAIHPTVGLGTYNRGRRGRNNDSQQMGNRGFPTRTAESHPGTQSPQRYKEPWNGRQTQRSPSQRSRDSPNDRQAQPPPPDKAREHWNRDENKYARRNQYSQRRPGRNPERQGPPNDHSSGQRSDRLPSPPARRGYNNDLYMTWNPNDPRRPLYGYRPTRAERGPGSSTTETTPGSSTTETTSCGAYDYVGY